MTDNRSILRLAFGLTLALALISPANLRAEKTDVVMFDNGDRLTGEVKKLEHGKLSFKTASTDTIQIEWDDVAGLSASETFDVETQTGERVFGSLAPGSSIPGREGQEGQRELRVKTSPRETPGRSPGTTVATSSERPPARSAERRRTSRPG